MSKKTPDMGKVKAALDKIEQTLKEHPELKERTQDFLTGKLEGKELISDERKALNIKVDPALIKRAEALIPKIQDDPELSALGRISTSSVMRLAILWGLEKLERKYG